MEKIILPSIMNWHLRWFRSRMRTLEDNKTYRNPPQYGAYLVSYYKVPDDVLYKLYTGKTSFE